MRSQFPPHAPKNDESVGVALPPCRAFMGADMESSSSSSSTDNPVPRLQLHDPLHYSQTAADHLWLAFNSDQTRGTDGSKLRTWDHIRAAWSAIRLACAAACCGAATQQCIRKLIRLISVACMTARENVVSCLRATARWVDGQGQSVADLESQGTPLVPTGSQEQPLLGSGSPSSSDDALTALPSSSPPVHHQLSLSMAPTLSVALALTSGWTGIFIIWSILCLSLCDHVWLSGTVAKAFDQIGRKCIGAPCLAKYLAHDVEAQLPSAAQLQIARQTEQLERERERRVEQIGRICLKRMMNQTIAMGWSAWHGMWSAKVRQRTLLKKTVSRLSKPKLSASYSFWKQSFLVGARAAKRLQQRKSDLANRAKEVSTQTDKPREKRRPEDSVTARTTWAAELRLEATVEKFGISSPGAATAPVLPIRVDNPGPTAEAGLQTMLTGPSPFSGPYPPRSWKPPSKTTREFGCQTSVNPLVKRKPAQPDPVMATREMGVQAFLAAPKPSRHTLATPKKDTLKSVGCGPGPWQWTSSGPEMRSTALSSWHPAAPAKLPQSTPRLPKVTLVFCNARSAHTPQQATPRRHTRSATSIDSLEPTAFFAPVPGSVFFYIRLRTTDPPPLNGPGWREPLQKAQGYASKRSIIWPSVTLDYDRVLGRDPSVNVHLAGALDLELCVPGDIHGLNPTLETTYHQLNLQTARFRSHLEDGTARISVPLMTKPRQGIEEAIDQLRAGPPPSNAEIDGKESALPTSSRASTTPRSPSSRTVSPPSTPLSSSRALSPSSPAGSALAMTKSPVVPALPLPAFLPSPPPSERATRPPLAAAQTTPTLSDPAEPSASVDQEALAAAVLQEAAQFWLQVAVPPEAEVPPAEAPFAEAPRAEAPSAEAPSAEAPPTETPSAKASFAVTSEVDSDVALSVTVVAAALRTALDEAGR